MIEPAGPGPDTPETLREFPVVVPLEVQWGDQDAFDHVNNVVYFRWCETARVVYLMRIGMWKLIEAEGRGPIVAAISCQFRRPVTFPDTVWVGARVSRAGNSSFTMEHRIVSQALDATVADAESTLVFFDYREQQPVPLPDHLREAIAKLEGTGGAS